MKPLHIAIVAAALAMAGGTTAAQTPSTQPGGPPATATQSNAAAQPHCVDMNGQVRPKSAMSGKSGVSSGASTATTGTPPGSVGSGTSPPGTPATDAQQKQASNGPPC